MLTATSSSSSSSAASSSSLSFQSKYIILIRTIFNKATALHMQFCFCRWGDDFLQVVR